MVFAFSSRVHPNFKLPIPQDAWQLLVLGGEEHELLPGMGTNSNSEPDYPAPSSTMVLELSENHVPRLSDNTSQAEIPSVTSSMDDDDDDDEKNESDGSDEATSECESYEV